MGSLFGGHVGPLVAIAARMHFPECTDMCYGIGCWIRDLGRPCLNVILF